MHTDRSLQSGLARFVQSHYWVSALVDALRRILDTPVIQGWARLNDGESLWLRDFDLAERQSVAILNSVLPANRGCRCGEMADAQDLKSWGPLKGRVGSSPTTGTSSLGVPVSR